MQRHACAQPGVVVVGVKYLQRGLRVGRACGVQGDQLIIVRRRHGGAKPLRTALKQQGRQRRWLHTVQRTTAGLPTVAAPRGVQTRLGHDVAIALEVHAGPELARQGQSLVGGDRKQMMLTAATGEGVDIAAQATVLLLQALEGRVAAVAWVDIDDHQARGRQRNTDVGLWFIAPPTLNRGGVTGGVVRAMRHQSPQRGLAARLQRQHMPAALRVRQSVVQQHGGRVRPRHFHPPDLPCRTLNGWTAPGPVRRNRPMLRKIGCLLGAHGLLLVSR